MESTGHHVTGFLKAFQLSGWVWGSVAIYCMLLKQMFMNIWLFLLTNTYFLFLEVSCGKYPIIKYIEFLVALYKSSKWELFVVPYSFERLVTYEGKKCHYSGPSMNTFFGIGLAFLYKEIIDRHYFVSFN